MDASNPSPHRRTWDTLPWLVAGSASAADVAHAMQHLPQCADCRNELAFQQRIQAELQAQVPADLPPPDAGLQRLWARLDVAEELHQQHGQQEQQGPKRRPSATLPRRTAPAWTRWLLAAVLLQAVGLGAAGLALLERSRDAGYRTLSRPPGAMPATTVRLVPAPGMDFATLRALLVRTRMAVVEAAPDGVSLGLAAQDGRADTSAAALATLRATPGVLLAEPVD